MSLHFLRPPLPSIPRPGPYGAGKWERYSPRTPEPVCPKSKFGVACSRITTRSTGPQAGSREQGFWWWGQAHASPSVSLGSGSARHFQGQMLVREENAMLTNSGLPEVKKPCRRIRGCAARSIGPWSAEADFRTSARTRKRAI